MDQLLYVAYYTWGGRNDSARIIDNEGLVRSDQVDRREMVKQGLLTVVIIIPKKLYLFVREGDDQHTRLVNI